MTTTPAMPELPEPDLGYIETDKSRQPAFSARQMRAALTQRPAAQEVDDLPGMWDHSDLSGGETDAKPEWRDLFWALARELKCLPSTDPGANQHVFRAARKLASLPAPQQATPATLEDMKVYDGIAAGYFADTQQATPEPAQADSSEHLRVIASLGAALRRLSFAAQTSGGTVGPDAELQAAIGQAEQALSFGGIAQVMFPATPEPVGEPNIMEMVNTLIASVNGTHHAISQERRDAYFESADRVYEKIKEAVATLYTRPAQTEQQPVASTPVADERAAFEVEMRRYGWNSTFFTRSNDGGYLSNRATYAFIGWQARASLPDPQQATPEPVGEPMFWYRPRSDGGYDGPLHDSSIGDVRKRSGAWMPLYHRPAPGVPEAWDEGYRQGVKDERTSEANIGIAGFGAKVSPARQNPYRAAAQAKGGEQ